MADSATGTCRRDVRGVQGARQSDTPPSPLLAPRSSPLPPPPPLPPAPVSPGLCDAPEERVSRVTGIHVIAIYLIGGAAVACLLAAYLVALHPLDMFNLIAGYWSYAAVAALGVVVTCFL